MYTEDTIAAIATPPGQGGIGIVRISGPLARDIGTSVLERGSVSSPWVPRRLYHGRIRDEGGGPVDDALGVFMPRPHSFTGEDVFELHCHGSPMALRRVLFLVLRRGARQAEPGEFTRRAFLNGRMDLAQAEAVIDLIRARSESAASLAARQLAGQLSLAINDVRNGIVRVKALLEAQIDFSEEDFSVSADELCAELDACTARVAALADSYAHGAVVRDGLRTAIVGRPNVGKSSLLNALLGHERAIVTAIAGTTRDSIDETVNFAGLPVVLSDTAGLRDAPAADAVELLGMERTAEKIAKAQLVILVLDASETLKPDDTRVLEATAAASRLVVLNKVDLPRALTAAAVKQIVGECEVIELSARLGKGLAELRSAVVARVHRGKVPEAHDDPVVSNLRHHSALRSAIASLSLARRSLVDGMPPDLVAVDVQDALDHIGGITGAVSNEEVLDRIFAEFCIGK